ncbi:MAG: hypothetical protein SGI88_20790 [Candidatus Hydrogenedentes bacterium]|nr:hypothetical protein [Candidatus Hydrogenedentota bacterium]
MNMNSSSAAVSAARNTFSGVNSFLQEWQLLGRNRSKFVEQMEPFQYCPADITYNSFNPDAQRFAEDFANALSESGWNITIGPSSKATDGIKIVTKSSALHAGEISAVVKWLRSAGLDAKVRVRQELETEAIQIVFGSIPEAMRKL